MDDDIVDWLRCSLCANTKHTCRSCEAADEIERLRAEIEGLRRRGDTLAYHVRAEEAKEMYSAVHAWEEASRG